MDRVARLSAGRHDARHLAVGVDLGGTWVRVVSSRDARPLRAPAVPVADLPRWLAALFRKRRWTRGRVRALVVASRAIWTAGERRALARRLRPLARRVRVLADAQAALIAALGGRPGVLVLAGTGSIVVGRDGRGRWARAGGFGPLLGDEGSAFWLGRAWLHATTTPGGFPTANRPALTSVAAIAALAPSVLRRARRGDRRARAVTREGQAHLARQVRDVVRRLGLRAPVGMSWAGSVLDDVWFRRGLARAVARAGVRARWRPPAVEPVAAALALAERLAAGAGRRR